MLILQSLKGLAGQSCISCWWNSPPRVFKHTSLRSIQRDFTLQLLTRAWKETLCHGALVQFSRWRRSVLSQSIHAHRHQPYFILCRIYLYFEHVFPCAKSRWADHSPNALVSVPKAFANSPPFSRGAQTSDYEPLKLLLKIISSYRNRLADSTLLFSIIIYESMIVMFSSQIIHSHYTCRVKWMVFNKEEESPCEAAELGNKVHRNTLLKHIAMLREWKLVIHHARLVSTLCCPTAIVLLAVCTHAVLCFLCSLIHCPVYLGHSFLLAHNWHSDKMIMVRLNRCIDAQPDRLVRNVCLKVSQYGGTFKCLKNLLYPLLFFFLIQCLKSWRKAK